MTRQDSRRAYEEYLRAREAIDTWNAVQEWASRWAERLITHAQETTDEVADLHDGGSDVGLSESGGPW